MIKKDLGRHEGDDKDCIPGVDYQHGVSTLACEIPVGSDFLLSIVPEHPRYEGANQYAYVPNYERTPGAGPYTINIVGQGIALTELNILAFSELLAPFA